MVTEEIGKTTPIGEAVKYSVDLGRRVVEPKARKIHDTGVIGLLNNRLKIPQPELSQLEELPDILRPAFLFGYVFYGVRAFYVPQLMDRDEISGAAGAKT